MTNFQERSTAAAVFLVEDDANDVFFFERAARRSGHQVELCNVPDGLEAIQHLGCLLGRSGAGSALPYQLVVLDLNLPSRSGLEVLEWIRSRPGLESLPVVILTSSLSDEDVEAAKRLGATAYHVKPAESRELANLVRLIFDEWLPATDGSTRDRRNDLTKEA